MNSDNIFVQGQNFPYEWNFEKNLTFKQNAKGQKLNHLANVLSNDSELIHELLDLHGKVSEVQTN